MSDTDALTQFRHEFLAAYTRVRNSAPSLSGLREYEVAAVVLAAVSRKTGKPVTDEVVTRCADALHMSAAKLRKAAKIALEVI